VSSLFAPEAFDDRGPEPASIGDDAWLVPRWLSLDEQEALLINCDAWGAPPAGAQRTVLPSGGVMSVRTACLGWQWIPYRYVTHAPDGAPVKPFPTSLRDLGRRALHSVGASEAEHYEPDVALINFYGADAKMGLHQDKDEKVNDPIVSVSLGASGVFRLGNTTNRSRPWTDVTLRSGDLVVFGGRSRLAFHGITKVLPETGPWVVKRPGLRVNITLRASGL
jgi:alkylated DNA repair protein (DNA oxidative demethylase)